MKTIVRVSVLALAVSGAAAGVITNHSNAPQQVAALSHQVILSAMPVAPCTPANCNIRGGK